VGVPTLPNSFFSFLEPLFFSFQVCSDFFPPTSEPFSKFRRRCPFPKRVAVVDAPVFVVTAATFLPPFSLFFFSSRENDLLEDVLLVRLPTSPCLEVRLHKFWIKFCCARAGSSCPLCLRSFSHLAALTCVLWCIPFHLLLSMVTCAERERILSLPSSFSLILLLFFFDDHHFLRFCCFPIEKNLSVISAPFEHRRFLHEISQDPRHVSRCLRRPAPSPVRRFPCFSPSPF